MIDESPRNCVKEEGDCEIWKDSRVSLCPSDCPYRMSDITDGSPEEVKAIRDIWEFTRKMLLLPSWTIEQREDVKEHLDEWRKSGRDKNEDADAYIDLLTARSVRFG